MSNKILIFGKSFISDRLQEELNCRLSERRIYSYQDAEREIKKNSPGIIINSVEDIGSNVDEYEKDLDAALKINAFTPIILAEAALRNHLRLIHISSGCIYHYDYPGGTPIDEERAPDYLELFYSRTKIYSEEALRILSRKYPVLIVRARIPLDNRPYPLNLLDKLIKYKKVIDIPNSVTYLPDFIKALRHLIKIKARGIYNVVNKGGLSYPGLLKIYKKYVPDFEYKTVDFKKLGLVRTNLILSTKKLEKAGFKVRNISEVLEECVQEYLKY